MTDSKRMLFYVCQNGHSFQIVEMTSTQAADWLKGETLIAEENTLKDAIARIKSESVEAIAFTAKCPALGHLHAAHYWPVGVSDALPRTCPNHGCGYKPLVREDFVE